jgi:hypothetical protein
MRGEGAVKFAAPSDLTPIPIAPSAAAGDDGALGAERAARLAAEKERDDLRAELARVKSGTGPVARLIEARHPMERDEPAAPEVAAARLHEIGPRVDEVLAKKDWEGAIKLLHELAPLGRSGWPLIDRLVNAAAEEPNANESDDGPDASDVGNVLTSLCSRGELRDLVIDALLEGSSYSALLRHLAAQAGDAIFASREETAELGVRLGIERDPDVVDGILAALTHAPGSTRRGVDPGVLLAAFQAQASAEARLAIARVLVETPDASPEALALLGKNGDDAVRNCVRLALLATNPPVRGYLVTGIFDDSAGPAGLLEGDIIVSYNGSEVRSTKQFERLMEGIAEDASVPIGVYRDGTVIPLTVRSGLKGFAGQVVRPGGN